MNMPHWSYQGWGEGLLLRSIIFSSMFRCMKWSQRLVRLVALPVNLSTRKFMDVSVWRKATRYYLVIGRSMDVVVAFPILTSRAASGCGQQWMPWPTPIHTTHTSPSSDDSRGEGLPRRSSTAHSMHQGISHIWAQEDTPLPMYLPR